VGKVENLHKLMSLFEVECTQLMADITAAIAAGDAVMLRRSGHTLKGAVAIFAAGAATTAAEKLESIGQTGNLADAGDAYTVLEREIKALLAAIETEKVCS
jgi:HPt (histidine-containing phosphotransfer) domain-containing protein